MGTQTFEVHALFYTIVRGHVPPSYHYMIQVSFKWDVGGSWFKVTFAYDLSWEDVGVRFRQGRFRWGFWLDWLLIEGGCLKLEFGLRSFWTFFWIWQPILLAGWPPWHRAHLARRLRGYIFFTYWGGVIFGT